MDGTTYARARLWTGISGVGTVVLLAAALLLLGLPGRELEGRGGTLLTDAVLLLTLLAMAAIAVLPFDLLGGFILPRRFGRPVRPARHFAGTWLRGVLALLVFTTANGTLLLAAGRAGGRPAALIAFVVVALFMVALQEPMARIVGGLRRVPEAQTRALTAGSEGLVLLSGADPGFSGGFTGLSATPVLPERWLHEFRQQELALLFERRMQILRSGAWRWSLVLAIAWNATGFLLASHLPNAGVRTVGELVTTALGFTLWTFLGLLLLPTPSRRATYAADASIAGDESSRELLGRAIHTLDQLQDDEPERSPGLESVFHPIPSAGNRVRALLAPEAGLCAWHLARTALYLSYAGVSLLPRVVHCNVGRPELWVYLPTDG